MPNNLFALCAHALALPGSAELHSACRLQVGDPRVGTLRVHVKYLRQIRQPCKQRIPGLDVFHTFLEKTAQGFLQVG